MKRARFLLALLLVAAPALPACASTDDGDAPVRVRVANASDRPFDSVRVLFPDRAVGYGPLDPGAESTYRQVARAYSYAGVEVALGADTLRMHPIDYVGETPLPPGRYTYVLSLDPGPPARLALELRRDP